MSEMCACGEPLPCKIHGPLGWGRRNRCEFGGLVRGNTEPLTPPRTRRQVCHRYGVESAAGHLGMGRLWPESERAKTLAAVRALPTYDPKTDTVVVCWYVD